jgi:hypothetical protein
MEISRYIITQAVQTKENILVPIWDDRIIFDKTEMFGNQIKIKGNNQEYYDVIECVFDLKTKKIEIGIELNYYPQETEFTKGENILFEKSHKQLAEAKITDIIYEEYSMTIRRGHKLDKYWLNIFKDVVFDDNAIYAIKQWIPFYILDNGLKIKWNHDLYHKV